MLCQLQVKLQIPPTIHVCAFILILPDHLLYRCVVLVAHNGFKFDFMLLLSELARRPEHFSTSLLEEHNIRLGDTLPLLQRVLYNTNIIFIIIW